MHDVNSQSDFKNKLHSAQKDHHISESYSENDVDEGNTHQDDNNDFPLSRPFRKIKRPAKLKGYEVDYQPHRANIALAYLTQAVQQDLEQAYFDKTMQSHNCSEWLHAIKEELDTFEENETWDLVPLTPGKHAIDNRWVLRIKFEPDGSIHRY